jgi:hypothetical protein
VGVAFDRFNLHEQFLHLRDHRRQYNHILGLDNGFRNRWIGWGDAGLHSQAICEVTDQLFITATQDLNRRIAERSLRPPERDSVRTDENNERKKSYFNTP